MPNSCGMATGDDGKMRIRSQNCFLRHCRPREPRLLQLKPLDQNVPIFQQIGTDVSSVVVVNIFQVAAEDIPALRKAWEADANWMKQQPGYISTQLHQGIAGSTVFMN